MGCLRVGNCLKSIKRVRNRKHGRVNKYFKKGGQAGSRGSGCLKKRGWSPLPNYVIKYIRVQQLP